MIFCIGSSIILYCGFFLLKRNNNQRVISFFYNFFKLLYSYLS
nr:MAG TPA: hypothetical protein [Caudoviricetes sp.]